MRYPIYTPTIQPYTTSITKAIADGWISSQGEFLEKAKEKCKEVLHVPYVVLVNNGTSATHLLYKSLKYKFPSLSTIYVPNYVFAAVWNCALYEYDSSMLEVLKTDPVTLNMCTEDEYILSLKKNSAVVVVHNIGNVVNVPRLKRLRPDIVFVEDCCEAFLEEYEDCKTGTKSLCGAISFFGNKIITTGEGGLWYTTDKELYEFIYKSCHHGMTSERYVYDVLGYNYRMTNLQAALLYDQLMDVDTILSKKRKVYNCYKEVCKDTPIQVVTTGLWMMVIRIPDITYDEFMKAMKHKGIDTRPMFYSLSTHSHLRHIPSIDDIPHHHEYAMIPSSPSLTTYDQVYIITSIKQYLRNNILQIHRATRPLLESFVSNQMPSTFRYFGKHTVDDCLKDHTLTIIGTIDDVPVAYGHIDDRWLGICILPAFQSKGYGNIISEFLVSFADIEKIPLRLSVDKQNTPAQALYKKLGFTNVRETESVYFMERNIKIQ